MIPSVYPSILMIFQTFLSNAHLMSNVMAVRMHIIMTASTQIMVREMRVVYHHHTDAHGTVAAAVTAVAISTMNIVTNRIRITAAITTANTDSSKLRQAVAAEDGEWVRLNRRHAHMQSHLSTTTLHCMIVMHNTVCRLAVSA